MCSLAGCFSFYWAVDKVWSDLMGLFLRQGPIGAVCAVANGYETPAKPEKRDLFGNAFPSVLFARVPGGTPSAATVGNSCLAQTRERDSNGSAGSVWGTSPEQTANHLEREAFSRPAFDLRLCQFFLGANKDWEEDWRLCATGLLQAGPWFIFLMIKKTTYPEFSIIYFWKMTKNLFALQKWC